MPGWKALPEELDPEVRAFTERIRRLIDRSGLGVTAVAERTGHERSAWDAYLNARRPAPRSAVIALAETTGADPADLTARWERARSRFAPEEGTRAGGPETVFPRGRGLYGGAPEVPDRGAPRGPATEAQGSGGFEAPGGPDGLGGPERPGGPEHPGDDHTMRIRRLDPTAPPAPIPIPIPVPAPAPTPRPRRTTVLLYVAGILGALLVVTAALLLVDLGGGDGADGGADGRATAPPTTPAPSPTPRTELPAGVKCSGADCAGRDPEAMGCGGPLAVTLARVRVGTAGVEVRHSAACAASWARITGAAPGATVSVEVAGATERATVPGDADTTAAETDAYTPMLAVAPGASARACGTLADGTGGCTAGR
ncbi:DUF2690 domain-containing protein [Streptomyces sp. NPDC012825]|uniref:helix-turn-helix domain-containing protein n=1 Tax=Streptomyces sp. NPDC012825 TaxID=3364851 RepID=UPI0036B6B09C